MCPNTMRVQACAWSLATLITLAACSTESQRSAADPWGPRWQETERLFTAGDIDGTLQQIEVLLDAGGSHGMRAAGWKMLILAGKARGYFELSEAYEAGARKNPWGTPVFRRASSTHRSHARLASLALAQMAAEADRYFDHVDTIPLDFPMPDGSTSPSPVVESVKAGLLKHPSQLTAAEGYSVRRAIALTMCEAARGTSGGADCGDDLAARPPAIPKPRLLAVVGRVLYEQADLFAENRLNDPDKYVLLLDLSERLLETSLRYQQQQKASLELWQTELQNRRSPP
jgi:hypothetical protein